MRGINAYRMIMKRWIVTGYRIGNGLSGMSNGA